MPINPGTAFSAWQQQSLDFPSGAIHFLSFHLISSQFFLIVLFASHCHRSLCHPISSHFISSHHITSHLVSSHLLSSSPLFSVDHNCSHLTSCPLIFFIFSDLFFVQLFSPPSFHAVRLNLVFFLPSAGTQTPKPGLGAKAGNTILNFKDTKLTRK